MNDSRFEWKVGLFVFGGVILLALLILNFSRGVTLFSRTYTLRVILPNAAGLKPTADVMMAGYTIGKVLTMELEPDEKSVDVAVRILSQYKIRKDAKFHVDALGFLGDQYIEVAAPPSNGMTETNETAYFQNGDTVRAEAQFNMMDAEKSITGLVNEAQRTIRHLDQAITNVNASALSSSNLSRFVQAMSNIEAVSGKAVIAMDKADNLLTADAQPFSEAITNFRELTADLTNSEGKLDAIIVTNSGDIRTIVTNLTVASDQIKQITGDLGEGKGPVGTLLKNEEMKAELKMLVSNADTMTAEFSTFGHNLNQRGIWAMLWKPKHVETNHVSATGQ